VQPHAKRRSAAVIALLCAAVAVVVAVVATVEHFPNGLTVLACIAGAVAAAWWAIVRSGAARTAGFAVAAALLLATILLVVLGARQFENIVICAAVLLALAAARRAFAVRAKLPSAPRPQRPVLFYNPKSGGGKAERFRVADEARRRGIEARQLRHGDDLAALVREAIRDGADALAMSGGDGSQAIVAAEAAAHGMPYACIPSGTRNHFALDLGVDRDDVVGALDAFVDGRERVVDLAEVNGRVFVNNVSLGIYAEAVQQAGYRDAKIRTLIETAPRALGSGTDGGAFRGTGPDGRERQGAATLLVSNDPYRLGRALGSGTRPRLDAGVLGIAAVDLGRGDGAAGRRFEEWAATEFEVRSDGPVPAGIDGESVELDPPIAFRSRPAVLRVRIAPQHPGASPSAAIPATAWEALRKLVAFALRRAGEFSTSG
jgi:diacylglycerol kinase family enzyme